jgi:hypothetical protein
MGYTHYWVRYDGSSDSKKFKEFSSLAAQLIVYAEHQGIDIADGTGSELGAWVVNDTEIRFNGFDEGSHETFLFPQECPVKPDWQSGNGYFDFTKTAYKPYDAVVTACLIGMKDIYGKSIKVSSDGDWDEWTAGREMYEIVAKKPAKKPF